jgi:DNA replication and repair protein RecF
MFVEQLSLTGFRSYEQMDLRMDPGVTAFVGPNGVGKTNIVEAVGYLSSLSSHRVSTDRPLVAFGAERALIRGRLLRGTQGTSVEVEINPDRANRARINRANPVPARNVLGILRTVLFAPEDLALVRGDPSVRRRFLDDLVVALVPHHAATRSEYERVLKQRNALLKSARSAGRFTSTHEATLEVWDQHLAIAGAALLHARLDVLERIRPHIAQAYGQLTDGSKNAGAVYQAALGPSPAAPVDDDGGPGGGAEEPGALGREELAERLLLGLAAARKSELERGMSLVGPHRDDVVLRLGAAPAKGYASHGETWSMALALRLGTYYLLMQDDPRPGAAPVLILDDVFAELDAARRKKLAETVASAEQVLVTAAVGDDIPRALSGVRRQVVPGGFLEAGG